MHIFSINYSCGFQHPEIEVDASGKRALIVNRHKNIESER